jgi:hypothetical protein
MLVQTGRKDWLFPRSKASGEVRLGVSERRASPQAVSLGYLMVSPERAHEQRETVAAKKQRERECVNIRLVSTAAHGQHQQPRLLRGLAVSELEAGGHDVLLKNTRPVHAGKNISVTCKIRLL